MLTFSFTLVVLNLNVFSFGDSMICVHTDLHSVYESAERNGEVLLKQTGD